MTGKPPGDEEKWLDEVEARCKAATPGPWYAKALPRYPAAKYRVSTTPDADWANFGEIAYMGRNDAEFVAHVRNDIDRLLALARRGLAQTPQERINNCGLEKVCFTEASEEWQAEKERLEAKVKELDEENQRLTEIVASQYERSEKAEARVKELEAAHGHDVGEYPRPLRTPAE